MNKQDDLPPPPTMTNLYSRTNDEAFDMMEEQWGVVSSKEWEKKERELLLGGSGKACSPSYILYSFFSPFSLLSPPPHHLPPRFSEAADLLSYCKDHSIVKEA